MRSAVVMSASDELLVNGVFLYPLTLDATILNLVEGGLLTNWTDAGGVWTYQPGTVALGTLTYVSDGATYTITKKVNLTSVWSS